MTDQDRTQLCKDFTILTGGHSHEWTEDEGNFCKCGVFRYLATDNSTYINPADVLKVILDKQGVGELETFLYCIGYFSQEDNSGADWVIKYIIEPDTLLKAAVEFLKEKKR